ncbi:hypothetical protein CRV24_009904 [Beauveria bassiana]|nr:hypothetical protein CRV24_009904 [Beauveria bassiana]KAH8708196.1 hypothetical protein HC256_010342 [Beauveria bassiana]
MPCSTVALMQHEYGESRYTAAPVLRLSIHVKHISTNTERLFLLQLPYTPFTTASAIDFQTSLYFDQCAARPLLRRLASGNTLAESSTNKATPHPASR